MDAGRRPLTSCSMWLTVGLLRVGWLHSQAAPECGRLSACRGGGAFPFAARMGWPSMRRGRRGRSPRPHGVAAILVASHGNGRVRIGFSFAAAVVPARASPLLQHANVAAASDIRDSADRRIGSNSPGCLGATFVAERGRVTSRAGPGFRRLRARLRHQRMPEAR